MTLEEKLEILSASARYDASCASSASRRSAARGGLGRTQPCGICHSFTPDGRCVSLLKILLTNSCIYDCRYCINRRSSDVPRAQFTTEEVAKLTAEFYRRNYIEGLFLSSAVVKNVDYTMEQMVCAVRLLRTEHRFGGYIHLKVMPGASAELVSEAGRWADRLSANIELATKKDLAAVAPQKSHERIEAAMGCIRNRLAESQREKKSKLRPPLFSPSGQSTQMIVGATQSPDQILLSKACQLYETYGLKRVYYSAFSPVSSDDDLLSRQPVPLMREHRLYQADWLYRYYGFGIDELVSDLQPNLDLEIDPKLAWALQHRSFFPVDINRASFETLLRVPGLGRKSVQRILAARKFRSLASEDLRRMRVPLSRAKYFLLVRDSNPATRFLEFEHLRNFILGGPRQLSLFSEEAQTQAISGEL